MTVNVPDGRSKLVRLVKLVAKHKLSQVSPLEEEILALLVLGVSFLSHWNVGKSLFEGYPTGCPLMEGPSSLWCLPYLRRNHHQSRSERPKRAHEQLS